MDQGHACMLCSERFESRPEWIYHLTVVHSIRIENRAPHPPQNIAPPTYYGNNVNNFPSPFSSIARQPPDQNVAQWYQTTHTSATPAAAPAAAAHLLTPPRSSVTTSPISYPRPVQTPAQFYPSPSSVPRQAPAVQSPQRYGTSLGHQYTLPRSKSSLSPHSLSAQSLQRQFSGSRPSSPPPTLAFGSPGPGAPSKLPANLPPLPQAVYDLGLTNYDFHPLADHGKPLAIASRYIDLPPSLGVPDVHMFNGNYNNVLCYGNLLRLAARYTESELMRNINSMRGKNKGEYIRSAFITKRIKSAVKWAADRPEWQGVGDVEAWLDAQRKLRETEQCAQLKERKRRDDTSEEDIQSVKQAQSKSENRQLPTPPTKRMRPTSVQTPQQSTASLAGYGRTKDHSQQTRSNIQAAIHAQKATPSACTLTPGPAIQNISHTSIDPESTIKVTISLLSPEPEDLVAQRGLSQPTNDQQSSAAPTSEALSSTAYSLRAEDLADLTQACGSENAMALVSALGMGDGLAPIAPEEPPAPSCEAAEPSVDYDDIFDDFLAQPDHFATPWEVHVGSAVGKFVEREMKAKGLRW